MNSIKKKLFSNTISNGLQFGSRWLMNIFFAHSFSISMFGIFSFIYSLSTLAGTIFSYGSNLYLLKQISENKGKGINYLLESFVITIILFVIFLILFLIFFRFFIPYAYFYDSIYGMFLALVFALNMSIFSFFKGNGKFEEEAKIYFIFSFFLLGTIMVAFYFGILSNMSLENVFIMLIFINLIPFFLGIKYIYIEYNLSLYKIKKNLFISIIYKIPSSFNQRLAFGIHESQSILFSNLPFLLLGILATSNDLGYYKAIYLLIVPFLILPNIIAQVLLNHLSNSKSNIKIFKKVFRKFLFLSLILASFISFVYWRFEIQIIHIIYGSKFNVEISSNLLHIFIFVLFFWFIKSNYEILLTSLDEQWFRVKILWITLLLYPILIFIFPIDNTLYKYAYALLISILFMSIIYIIKSEKKINEIAFNT